MGISKINVNGIDVPITPDIEDGSIEKAKLAEAVQESLEKADSALQEVPDTYRTSEEQDEIDNAKVDKTTTVNGHALDGNITVTKSDVGLGNVDNTSDADKPISDATQEALDAINEKIPSQASSDNKLADKDYVDSSIATETAHYISDHGEPFTSALLLPTEGVTNNDYAFVTGTDEQGNAYFDRYKATVVGSSVTWGKEYRLNNSSFTAAQWAAISSGITAALVGKLGDLPTAAELTTALAGKQSTLTSEQLANIADVPNKEDASNKENTITPTSTTKYPSSKAVADYVAEHGGGGDTSEIEEAAAAALNELWWKTLSPARKTVLREDIIDDFKHPYSSHPISARIAKVIDEHLKEIELIAASALVNLNEMKAFIGAIAPEWDGQHAYNVGDLRTHGGKLWKCDTAYDEPEDTFDAAKWHTTTIIEEFITAE